MGEVAADVGLPEGAKVYHFHPIGMFDMLSVRLHPVITLYSEDIELEFLGIYKGEDLTGEEINSAAKEINSSQD